MKLSNRLENFRADNPFDVGTQAKRLLATKDDKLIMYVLELGLTLAKSRQRHEDRSHMKETGYAKSKEKLIIRPGRVTGSVIIKPGRRTQNAIQQLVLDTWRINGEQKLGDATAADLGDAIKRENVSANGHKKNAEFYDIIRKPLKGDNIVRSQWNDDTLRPKIEAVYGEFRQGEAA